MTSIKLSDLSLIASSTLVNFCPVEGMSLLVTAVVTGLDATAFTNGAAATPATSTVALPVVAKAFNATGKAPTIPAVSPNTASLSNNLLVNCFQSH